MALESFNVYHSYLKAIEPLNDAERGRLLTACLEYSMTGVVPELSGNERYIFPSWQSQIDRDNEKYEEKCRKQRENINKRWNTKDTTVYHGIPSDTNDTKDKDKDKDYNPPIVPPEGGRARFIPPSVEEVQAYCQERNNGIDAEEFISFYQSKGWMIGKNKMKDWKAAVRTWEKSREKESPSSSLQVFT